MKEVHVLVVGEPNSGKSTIALELARLLKDAGIDVELHDEQSTRAFYERQATRLEELKQRGVTIVVKNIAREAIETNRIWRQPKADA